MKRALLLFLLGLTGAEAQQPIDQVPPILWNIKAELLITRMPESRAMKFRRELVRPEFAKAAQDELLRLIETKEADLVDWPIIQTSSGARASTSNARRHSYPIEFTRPNVISTPYPSGAETVELPTAPSIKKPLTNADDATKRVASMLAGVPSSFEARDAGVSMEMEATVSDDGKRIQVNASPKHVVLKGYRSVKIESEGHTVVVEQPEFEIFERTGQMQVISGESILWSFQKLKEPANTVELSVLTVTAIDPAKEAR